MFVALPKNSEGNLAPAAAKYALFRLFRSKYAWLVKGLAPEGKFWNATSPAGVLQDDKRVQDVFEQHLKADGLSLKETGLLAAIIEELVHDEAVERLRTAYDVLDFDTDDDLDRVDVES